jgi:hypothetical protein
MSHSRSKKEDPARMGNLANLEDCIPSITPRSGRKIRKTIRQDAVLGMMVAIGRMSIRASLIMVIRVTILIGRVPPTRFAQGQVDQTDLGRRAW